jgi:HAMP domain-containing protein
MDTDYLIVGGALALGCAITITSIYLLFKKGFALYIVILTAIITISVGFLAFFLGKNGITLGRAVICLVIMVPLIIASHYYVIRKIVLPVRELKSIGDKISLGDANVTIPEYGDNEVGELANSFRTMTAYLREGAMVTC